MTTFAEHVRARADDDRVALRFEDDSWTYREWVRECAARAALFDAMRVGSAPHIGLLLENVPDFTMWTGAAAVAGATVVGLNPTRRGTELARDVTHTECQIVVTDATNRPLLDDLDLGAATGRVLVVDDPAYADVLAPHRDARLPDVHVDPSTQLLLLFTSGTSGAPKAVICSHARLNRIANGIASMTELHADDVSYISMPLFHSNALFVGWGPALVVGATVALRRRFSASGFLPDVRKFGATFFNYVGKPLTYVVATPERPDDADNPLVRGYGNEGAEADIRRFEARFACRLTDGFGSTETGLSISRVDGMPPGALGVATTVKVMNPDTGEECPRAVFDADGRLLNADEATGELVNFAPPTFEGYWRNEEANAERLRDGAYWSGDLGYRDSDDYFYFAGRSADWMRVDGENFAGAPIERIVARHPDVLLAAVYGVPAPDVGDRVMTAIQLVPGARFDADDFASFLAAQRDLGPKWVPTYVRVVDTFPMTETNKVLKRELARQRFDTTDELWWRPGRDLAYVPFDPANGTVTGG
ncbi:MAG TPA: AMP-binding protein [Acidimicrobiia bacterium]|nr:AMP-binding protein [Acidimicrobiia bacterium]